MRRQESPDSDDDIFISDDDSYISSDGSYHEHSDVDDYSRAEKKQVTPSPQKPRYLASAKTKNRIRKTIQELSDDDDDNDDENNNSAVKRTGARRKIILESDDDDTNDNHHEAKLPPLPLPRPNFVLQSYEIENYIHTMYLYN